MHRSLFEPRTPQFSTFKICELQSLDYFTKKKESGLTTFVLDIDILETYDFNFIIMVSLKKKEKSHNYSDYVGSHMYKFLIITPIVLFYYPLLLLMILVYNFKKELNGLFYE